jgi:2-methylcitrate dehydratase PrpD
MDATVALMRAHGIDPGAVADIEIRSFAEAVRLGVRLPRSTEEAQYAIGFPVAAVAVRGVLGAAELSDAGLNDGAIGAMLARLRLTEEPDFSARFPAERLAAVTLTLRDGTRLCSPPTTPRGDPEDALSDREIFEKFRRYAGALGERRVAVIERAVAALEHEADALPALNEAILAPIVP